MTSGFSSNPLFDLHIIFLFVQAPPQQPFNDYSSVFQTHIFVQNRKQRNPKVQTNRSQNVENLKRQFPSLPNNTFAKGMHVTRSRWRFDDQARCLHGQARKNIEKALTVSLAYLCLRFHHRNINKTGPTTSPKQHWWPRGIIYLVMRVSAEVVGAAWGPVRSSSGPMQGARGL